jgi:hypothetical protein
MTGWPTQSSFSRAAKVGDNYATISETEKISGHGNKRIKKAFRTEKFAFSYANISYY